MSKSNFSIKNLNKFNKFINSILEKNLNKLNFKNLSNLIRNNIIILVSAAFVVLFLSYLLLPTFYKQSEISVKLQKELNDNFNINFKVSENLNYNFFPKPHFTISQSSILSGENEISQIKNLIIYVSLKNFFSINNIKIKDVIIDNANFNLNNKNYNFFIKILNNNFLNRNLKIKNSNIFFRNNNNEVLFINKILNLNYSYSSKELKNFMYSENEIFNLPYIFQLFHDTKEYKFLSKLNLKFFKLQIENEHRYHDKLKKGTSNLIFKKNKSIIEYKTNQNFFEFDYFDKLDDPKFFYKGNFNFNPFYSSIEGNTDILDLNYFLDTNSVITQLLKTEIFNNKNIDFKLNINAKNIYKSFSFKNLIINSKIEDGLIDIDNTSFNWKKAANFKLSETLIYVKDGELVLDGKFKINIKNYDEIYKFLLTPRNYRKKIKELEFNFTYKFDKQTAHLKDIKIDNIVYENLNVIFNNLVIKNDNLQNKIYFKNLLNKAIKSYSG